MKKLLAIFSCIIFSLSNYSNDYTFMPPVQRVDSLLLDSMIAQARLNGIQGNAELSLKQAKWTYNKALSLGNDKLIAQSHFYVASGYRDVGYLDSSLFHYKYVVEEMRKASIAGVWLYYAYSNPLRALRLAGRFDEALKLGFEGIEAFEELGDSNYVGVLFSDVGYIFDRMKEFKLAIKWQKKSRRIFQELDDDANLVWVNTRLGIAFDELARFDSAHFYNQKAFSNSIKVKDTSATISISSNIANTYLKQKEWLKALEYSKKAANLCLISDNDERRAIVYINLATAQMNLGNYTVAKEKLLDAIYFAKEWNTLKYQSEAYDKLHQLFLLKQNQDSALYYYKKFSSLEDTLYNIEKTNQVLELNTRFETEKKEKEIQLKDAKLSEKESEIKTKQRTIIALIILGVSVFVIVYALYKRAVSKKNAELREKVILQQEKGIQAVFQAQEEERKRISKDLHDGVGQQLSGIKMAFYRIAKGLKEKDPKQKAEMEELANVIANSAAEVRSISHQMMPRVLTEVGLNEAIRGMLDKSLKLSGIEFEFNHLGIIGRLPENVEIGLYRVCQELVNNIIKHSGAKNVSVQLVKNQQHLILLVEDDGKGIKSVNKGGHGLLNMRSRVSTLNGEINLESSPMNGVLATVRIPVQ